jgi:branched-subunit amino acid transport protein
VTLWLTIIGMGIVTYAVRLSFLVFIRHESLPEAAREALQYVLPAVMAAVIVPAALYVDGSGEFEPWLTNPRVPAAVVAGVVAWYTGSAWATIGGGMAVLWLLEWAF